MDANVDAGSAAAETAALLARLTADKSAALARLAAGVAHELRNPLAVILARAQLLALGLRQGRAIDQGKIESVLKTIEEQALRASRVIESLSTFARPRQPEVAPVDVGAVVEDVLAVLQARAEAVHARVDVTVEDGPLTVSADREQVTTALTQLVVNALEAIDGGGRLAVHARRVGDRVELAVRDSGPGVAAHDAERIFDPFFSTKPAAAGLGLCVAQTIAEAHGGVLRLLETGAGAEFVLALPAVISRA